MTTVKDPKTGRFALVQFCRVCFQAIYFGYTVNGKRCPYDLNEQGEPTEISHFTTCPKVREWTGVTAAR
jgi:hypothetical protein